MLALLHVPWNVRSLVTLGMVVRAGPQIKQGSFVESDWLVSFCGMHAFARHLSIPFARLCCLKSDYGSVPMLGCLWI